MRHLSRFQLGRVGLVVAAVTLGTSTAVAQARQPSAAPRDTTTRPIRDTLRAAVRDSLRPSTRDFLSMVETPPVMSRHSIRVHGSTLSYTATTGMLPIRNDTTLQPPKELGRDLLQMRFLVGGDRHAANVSSKRPAS